MEILPHRRPFLFVDRVIELEVDSRILAAHDIDASAPHFEGHFPKNPIMPGVLICEALAQTSGLLHALSSMQRGDPLGNALFYLARSDIKWTSPCRPGETLLLESKLQRTMGGLLSFRVAAFTKRNDVAGGTLTIAAAPAASRVR